MKVQWQVSWISFVGMMADYHVMRQQARDCGIEALELAEQP